MQNLIRTELLEDLKDIVVEHEFGARWLVIEGWHKVGKRILEEFGNDRKKIYGEKISQHIAESLGKSERTINYAISFAERFDSLDKLPEGKNVSWGKVVREYLTEPKEESECEHIYQEIWKCKKCGQKK